MACIINKNGLRALGFCTGLGTKEKGARPTIGDMRGRGGQITTHHLESFARTEPAPNLHPQQPGDAPKADLQQFNTQQGSPHLQHRHHVTRCKGHAPRGQFGPSKNEVPTEVREDTLHGGDALRERVPRGWTVIVPASTAPPHQQIIKLVALGGFQLIELKPEKKRPKGPTITLYRPPSPPNGSGAVPSPQATAQAWTSTFPPRAPSGREARTK